VEFPAIGPVPFCGMLLADMGADILRIDREAAADLGLPLAPRYNISARGRRSILADIRREDVRDSLLKLIEKADVLIEGFRPGVMERLGYGPDVCLARNPRLVYARVTGWGQTGSQARAAGHDINYVALSGALHAIGPGDGAPAIPLNLLGDYAGGGAYAAFGIVCALRHAAATGAGQVVDTAMCDGVTSLMSMCFGRLAADEWNDLRESNSLDGGLPWYSVYETADHRHVAIGALEQRFYDELLRRMGLDADSLPPRDDAHRRDELRAALAARFRQKSRDEWCSLLDGCDACFSPVLTLEETLRHPHHATRETFVEIDGVAQPAPAPRLSLTPGQIARPAPRPGEGGVEALRAWGLSDAEINMMEMNGIHFEENQEAV
jgi:alpha-methylacyl-CoA racemase